MVITITKKEQTKKVMLFDIAACLVLSFFFYTSHVTLQQSIPWLIMILVVAFYSLVNLPNRAAISEDFFRRVMNKLSETIPVQAVGPSVWKRDSKEPPLTGALVLTDSEIGFYPFLEKEKIADTSIFTVELDKISATRADKKNTLTVRLEDGTEVSYTVNKEKVWAGEIDKLLQGRQQKEN